MDTAASQPGAIVCAYHRDKWQPATLVKAGRKWAVVKINGNSRNSKVPVAAIRPLRHKSPQPDAIAAAPESPAMDPGFHLDECDSYLRLIDSTRVVGVIPKAHRQIADEIVAALRAWRVRESAK